MYPFPRPCVLPSTEPTASSWSLSALGVLMSCTLLTPRLHGIHVPDGREATDRCRLWNRSLCLARGYGEESVQTFWRIILLGEMVEYRSAFLLELEHAVDWTREGITWLGRDHEQDGKGGIGSSCADLRKGGGSCNPQGDGPADEGDRRQEHGQEPAPPGCGHIVTARAGAGASHSPSSQALPRWFLFVRLSIPWRARPPGARLWVLGAVENVREGVVPVQAPQGVVR
ncbi:hypothetical protein LZ30DRAFT_740590 [Colletotrichum cereale]|nr:hypothetical protein LZ30DRAFT_740590 [Colletotrichum cereale]